MTKFMITVRAIESGAFGGGLGKARYLSVPDGATPAPPHEVTMGRPPRPSVTVPQCIDAEVASAELPFAV